MCMLHRSWILMKGHDSCWNAKLVLVILHKFAISDTVPSVSLELYMFNLLLQTHDSMADYSLALLLRMTPVPNFSLPCGILWRTVCKRANNTCPALIVLVRGKHQAVRGAVNHCVHSLHVNAGKLLLRNVRHKSNLWSDQTHGCWFCLSLGDTLHWCAESELHVAVSSTGVTTHILFSELDFQH